jgi:hypothetical protein
VENCLEIMHLTSILRSYKKLEACPKHYSAYLASQSPEFKTQYKPPKKMVEKKDSIKPKKKKNIIIKSLLNNN